MTDDVKIFESERLTDAPDGGGQKTSNEIVSGVPNNLFPDLSRIDRSFGVVELRKFYVCAVSADTALYNGLHAMVLDGPDDSRVSALLFTTNSWTDTRAEAKAALERYLDPSVPTPMIPFDRQLEGSRQLLVFQRKEEPLPEIGHVYVITALPDEAVYQFVRVRDVQSSVRTFTDPDSRTDFEARVITLTLYTPLTTSFVGSKPTRFFDAAANSSQVRDTIVSDATALHSIHKLREDVDAGSFTLKLDSVYTQLIPASTAQASILGARPGDVVIMVPSGPAIVGDGLATFTGVGRFYVGTGILPGSIRMRNTNSVLGTDKGDGTFEGAALADLRVDYALGVLTYPVGNTFQMFIDYTPAAAVSKAAQSLQIPISQSNRGWVYNRTLRPPPAPGTTALEYRALGKWVRLVDDGTGALVGATGEGSGLVDAGTGILSVSLGAQPDVDSSINITWGVATEFEVRTTDVNITPPKIVGDLPAGNCEPGEFAIAWESGGVGKAAIDDGEGNITGDATGRLVYGSGHFELIPTALPDPTTSFDITYRAGAVQTELFNPSKSGSTITMVTAEPIKERSLLITYQQTITLGSITLTTTQQLIDNGTGSLVDANGDIKAGSVVVYDNAGHGEISFNPDFTMVTPTVDYQGYEQHIPARTADPSAGYYAAILRFGLWPSACAGVASSIGFVNGTETTVQYKRSDAVDADLTHSIAAPPLVVDLTPLTTNTVVPSGLAFTVGGRRYIDRNGTLYYGIASASNAGTAGGTLNYSTGKATLSSWVGGASHTLMLEALLTQVRPLPQAVVTGRVSAPALQPESFYISATRMRDGALIDATADVNGNISTSAMHGYVDVNTTIYSVDFGQYVLDSSLSADDKAEPWYSASAVDADGYIFRPDEIVPGSVTYNATALTSLPLDPTVLGVNPDRLPLDGRVQTVREGYLAIIHDTQVTTMPDGLTAGQVVALPRDNLESVQLLDQDGLAVDTALYTVDRETGDVTMATPLDLSAYDEPLVAVHRIEDSYPVAGVQITGEVTLGEPLQHSYTAANSKFSTALIAPAVGGSVQARIEHLFSQQTWDSAHPNWTDAIVGNPTTPQFNALEYPIQVLNRDAIQMRWAMVFTGATTYYVVGESLGVIGTGTTGANLIINGPSGQPYWEIDYRAFGAGGWANANAIRFNTTGAGFPAWAVRPVRAGPVEAANDSFTLEPRWDKD